jgi:hypothetical protein
MVSTVLRCSRRSSMAAAIMGSSLKVWPHEAIPLLVVSAMLPLRYRWEMTWKSAAAPSLASGR